MLYPHLFQPLKLRNLVIPNRTVMPPMSTQLGTPGGLVTPAQIAFYRARAKGGTGMIIVEFCCVHRASGQSEPNQLALEDESHVEGHRRLVRAIRDGGAVACLQLQHGGGAARRSLLQVPEAWGPSAVVSPKNPQQLLTRAMTHADIEFMIECFGRSAELGVKAGYQAVELHGAHGYLLTQFLSPRFNQREDAWGGSESNRMEFPRRVIARVRKAIGNRPLILRISADEFTPTGLTLADMERITPQLVSAGVDALHVSLGIGPDSFNKVLEPMSAPEGWRLPYARRIRAVNRVPVIAVGQIRMPHTAEQALANGDADLIALGRTLLADPDWANKARAGRDADIIPCTSCNFCVSNGFQERSIACANNPRSGRETQLPARLKRSHLKQGQQRAVVVGGGPGGMAAALLLDQAGFQTQLVEARATLGGGLIASAAPPHKELIRRYQHYLQRQLASSRVSISLNTPVSAAELLAAPPDVVIVATGAGSPILPPELQPPPAHTLAGNPALPDSSVLPDGPALLDAYALLMGDPVTLPALDAGPLLVYGGGETGCETAEYLLARGYSVILVSRSGKSQLARSAEMIYRGDLLQRLLSMASSAAKTDAAAGALTETAPTLTLLTDTRVSDYSNGSASFHHLKTGAEHRCPVAAMVLAQGRQTDTTLTTALQAAGIHCITIGDARQGGRIGDAVQDAWNSVQQLCS
jgi:2,4-dienoyl-CoA reductase-like NADH-dependent reductase (Old Yellow Enzyme family)